MRLQLGLLGKNVADQFSISSSLFLIIFKTWVNVLSLQLYEVFPWPSSEMIMARTPVQVRKYKGHHCGCRGSVAERWGLKPEALGLILSGTTFVFFSFAVSKVFGQ